MFSRTLVRIGTGSAFGAVFLTTAYTAEAKNVVKVSELPLYGEPSTAKLEVVEEKISPYRQHISLGRQFIWQYYDSIKETRDAVSATWDKVYAFSKDGLVFLQEDSATVPRIAFISLSGLGGIIIGYRGGIFRKLIYATLAMELAAAICYPQQATQLTKEMWGKARGGAEKIWGEQLGTSQDKTLSTSDEVQPAVPIETLVDLKAESVKLEHQPQKSEPHRAPGDQSIKSDRDLLTTRGKV